MSELTKESSESSCSDEKVSREEYRKLLKKLKQQEDEILLYKKMYEDSERKNKKLESEIKELVEKFPGRKPYSNEEVIKKIYCLYLDGLCIREVAKKLNDLGIKTRQEKEWSKSAIGYILKNPVNFKKGYISEEKFNNVIKLLDERQSKKPYSDVEIIKKIYNLYLNKLLSTSEIATELNTLKIKTKRNKEWTQSSVGYVLKSYFNVENGYISEDIYSAAMKRYSRR